MSTLIRSIVLGIVKGVVALALGGAILWEVVEHCGPAKGIAYVHVAKSQVNVTVDDETYWVETLWDTPIVCTLHPGRHMLRMLQHGHVLYEEEFTLEPGEEVVLTAWEGYKEKRGEEETSSHSFNPLASPSRLARRNP
jgi:hypothetical protein